MEKTAQRITVYVRLGAGDNDAERNLSFNITEHMSQKVLLEKGLAIDGNQALVSISRYFDDTPGLERHMWGSTFVSGDETLAESLRNHQQELVRWLGESGYEVTFK